MKPELSKELREYLRSTLGLTSALPEPQDDPKFHAAISTDLEPYHERLGDDLKNAFRDEGQLRSLVAHEMNEDFSTIPDGKSYLEKILNTIEWMDSRGYLLEFIAAAHRRNSGNPRLNSFVRILLKDILQSLIPQQQAPPPEIKPAAPEPQVKGSDGRANTHSAETKNGVAGRETKPDDTAPSAPPEAGQLHMPAQITSITRKLATTDKPSPEDPIASAYKRTRTSREKIQLVYDMFQNGENISDAPTLTLIKEAKNAVDRISDIFETTPTPDHPELGYRFASREKCIYNNITCILAYALQGKTATSPSIFQNADKEFKTIISDLQKLEGFIKMYEQQIQSSNQADEPLLESGS